MSKFKFYLLSFTWGLPMTLIGCVISLVLLIAGYKPKKWGYCYYFEIGECWGGSEFGAFFLCDKMGSEYIKNHEFGHGLQNCYWGFLMPFVVCIPSAYRYWLTGFKYSKMKYFAWGVYSVAILLSAVLTLIAFLTHIYWLLALAIFVFLYFTIIHIWGVAVEIPKRKGDVYVSYDSVWFEGQASKWGTEFIKNLRERGDIL